MNNNKRDSLIYQRILQISVFQGTKNICCYVSLSEEVDTKKIISQLLKNKKSVVVPRVSGDELTLHRIESMDDLQIGTFGILEPKNNCPEVPKVSIDLFIVPGVAFDREGNRIGRGRGYYDRLLEGVSATKIGLAYDSQIVPRLDPKKYDIPMDVIVTENETINPNSLTS